MRFPDRPSSLAPLRLTPVAVQQGVCAGGDVYRFALNIGTAREDQMFDVSKRIPTTIDIDDKPEQAVGGTLLAQLADAEGQRIYLPRGSAQSRFEPRSY